MRCSGEHQQALELHSRADPCTPVYCQENGLKPASDGAGKRPVPHSPHTAHPALPQQHKPIFPATCSRGFSYLLKEIFWWQKAFLVAEGKSSHRLSLALRGRKAF